MSTALALLNNNDVIGWCPNNPPSGSADLFCGRISASIFGVSKALSAGLVTNPALKVDQSTASAVTGLVITSNIAGGGVSVAPVGGNATEDLIVAPKGSGNILFKDGSGNEMMRVKAGASNADSMLVAGPIEYGTANEPLWRAGTSVLATRNAAGTVVAWLQNTAARARLTANATENAAAMANLTDLTLTLKAARKYTGKLVMFVSTDQAAEGAKFDFDGGAATMTSFAAAVSANAQGATAGVTVSAAIATDLTFTALNGTGVNCIVIELSMVVNAAGTFIPRFSQNTHTSGTLTAVLGCYLWLEDSPN